MKCAAVALAVCLVAGCAPVGNGGRQAPAGPGPMPMARVIVELRVAAAASDAERLTAMTQTREALLRQLPAGSYRVTRRFETIPFVALEISEAARRVLDTSPLVAGVQPDAVDAPQ